MSVEPMTLRDRVHVGGERLMNRSSRTDEHVMAGVTFRSPSTMTMPMRLPLDPDTAERLLRGALPADDAPPGYGPVATLLRALAVIDDGLEPSLQPPTVRGVRGDGSSYAHAVEAPTPPRRTARDSGAFSPPRPCRQVG